MMSDQGFGVCMVASVAAIASIVMWGVYKSVEMEITTKAAAYVREAELYSGAITQTADALAGAWSDAE